MGVRGPSEFEDAFKAADRARATALFVIEEGTFFPHRGRILSLAAQHRLPAASQFREFAEAGGLLSYGPNLPDLFRRAAIYVDKILKGVKPADLPVEQPDEVRAGHQPQDREGPRAHNSAVAPAAGGSGDRVDEATMCTVVRR